MTSLAWPLQRNLIRRQVKNHAFGMVRNGGTRAHQGWDLVATPLTPCYAIADGVVANVGVSGSYGRWIELRFDHARFGTLYAVYCHLSFWYVKMKEPVVRSQVIGLTGNTGNAASMQAEDQHLHFEIRNMTGGASLPGLAGRIDPALLYGRAPIGFTFFEGHGSKVSTAGANGLKVRGVNVREDVQ